MQKIDSSEQYLTYKEARMYLKISKASLMRNINDPENPLQVTYIGARRPRIRTGDLLNWLFRQDQLYNKKIQEDPEETDGEEVQSEG